MSTWKPRQHMPGYLNNRAAPWLEDSGTGIWAWRQHWPCTLGRGRPLWATRLGRLPQLLAGRVLAVCTHLCRKRARSPCQQSAGGLHASHHLCCKRARPPCQQSAGGLHTASAACAPIESDRARLITIGNDRARLIDYRKPGEEAHEYRRQHRATADKSEVVQRAKGRNLSNNNNCLPTNTSTLKATIHSIKITRLWSQAKELEPLALSHTLICEPLIFCRDLARALKRYN